MTAAARRRLAAAQAELVEALLAGGTAPAGFDPHRLQVQARALLAKRRRVTAHLRPDLAEALGQRYPPLFDQWALSQPRRVGVTARADATAFEHWLTEHGHLPATRPLPWWRRSWTG